MRSSESIACSIAYIQRAPDLSPDDKQRLVSLVRVLDIEVTTINHSTQPVTYVVDYLRDLTTMDTPAAIWLAQMPRSEVA